MHTGFWSGDMKERENLEDLSIDGGGIVLKWIFIKWDGGAQTGLIWLRTGTVTGCCECGNELLGFIKCREFVDCRSVIFTRRTLLH